MQAEATTNTKMQAPKATVRMRAIRECRVDDVINMPGTEFDAPEELAKDFEKPISGSYNFDGFRTTGARDCTTDRIVRAERL